MTPLCRGLHGLSFVSTAKTPKYMAIPCYQIGRLWSSHLSRSRGVQSSRGGTASRLAASEKLEPVMRSGVEMRRHAKHHDSCMGLDFWAGRSSARKLTRHSLRGSVLNPPRMYVVNSYFQTSFRDATLNHCRLYIGNASCGLPR